MYNFQDMYSYIDGGRPRDIPTEGDPNLQEMGPYNIWGTRSSYIKCMSDPSWIRSELDFTSEMLYAKPSRFFVK
jgi:hypothetical protein